VTTVTSYDDTSKTNTLNEVKYTYNDWNLVTVSRQDHAGAVQGSEPAVQYDWSEVAVGGAKNVRLHYVQYPGPSTPRKVYYHSTDSDTSDSSNWSSFEKIAHKLNRVTYLATVPLDGSDMAYSEIYAAYRYHGSGTIEAVCHWQQAGSLTLANNLYTPIGEDRFGRVTDNKWRCNSEFIDRWTYEYSGPNRTRRVNVNRADTDLAEWVYAYDGLDRLIQAERGEDVDGDDVTRYLAYTLDQLGKTKRNKTGTEHFFD